MGGDAVAVAVAHGSGYSDEGDPLHAGCDEVGQPPPQRSLAGECGDLGAQTLDAAKFRGDELPVVQDVEFRLHFHRPVVVLVDHAGDHDVTDKVGDTGFGGDPRDLASLLDLLGPAAIGVGRHHLQSDR